MVLELFVALEARAYSLEIGNFSCDLSKVKLLESWIFNLLSWCTSSSRSIDNTITFKLFSLSKLIKITFKVLSSSWMSLEYNSSALINEHDVWHS